MLRGLRSALAAVLLLLWLAPVQVSAYSYGDANTEDVAETFKVVVAALSGGQSDWKTVSEAQKVRRSEIAAHFGEAVAVTLDKNIEAKDSALLIANYKAVLVMNLDRRFTYANKDVGDYAGTKLLLAKAKATFDTLAPYMSSGTDAINKAFDEALDALGNPGLFGVGKKDSDPDLFKQKIDFIYGKVKPGFPYKAYVKPAAAEPEPETTKPVKEPAASAKPEPSPSKEPAETKKPTTVKEPAAKPSPSPTPSASAAVETPASAEPSESESPSAEAEPSPSAEPSEAASPSPSASASASAEAAPEASASASADAGQEAADPAAEEPEAAAETAVSEVALQDGEHAPMERTNKVNPLITVLVIAGVVVVGGGALWFIRKKGLI